MSKASVTDSTEKDGIKVDIFDLYVSAISLRISRSYFKSVFLIFSGLQDFRISNCDWEIYNPTYIWVAGTAGDPTYTEGEIRRLLKLGHRQEIELAFQGYAENTVSQADWFVERLNENSSINFIYLSTAAYHLPRCILTFIKSWQKGGNGRRLLLGAVPTISSKPSEGFSAGSSDKSGSVIDEIKRIEIYQEKGDVATQKEFFDFIEKSLM